MEGEKPQKIQHSTPLENFQPDLIVENSLKLKQHFLGRKFKYQYTSDIVDKNATQFYDATNFHQKFYKKFEFDRKKNLLNKYSFHSNWRQTEFKILEASTKPRSLSLRSIDSIDSVSSGIASTSSLSILPKQSLKLAHDLEEGPVSVTTQPQTFRLFPLLRFVCREFFMSVSFCFQQSFKRIQDKYYLKQHDAKKQVYASSKLQAAISKNPKQNQALANHYFHNLAANPNWLNMSSLALCFLIFCRFIWPSGIFYDKIYLKMIEDHLKTHQKVADLGRNKGKHENGVLKKNKNIPVIYLPLHKSHLDYLLFYLLLCNNNLSAPHTIAGDNLSPRNEKRFSNFESKRP